MIQSNEKKPLYFQSTMFTEFLPGAKVLDKLTVSADRRQETEHFSFFSLCLFELALNFFEKP